MVDTGGARCLFAAVTVYGPGRDLRYKIARLGADQSISVVAFGIGDAFGKLGDMNKLRQQAMAMQKALQAQVITVEENGVLVEITGDQKILKIEIQGMSNQVLNDVINKAIRKSQELAAKELMNVSGGQMGGN